MSNKLTKMTTVQQLIREALESSNDELLDSTQTAVLLGISKGYLQAMRSQGKGPKPTVHHLPGTRRSVRYKRSDVAAYIVAQGKGKPGRPRRLPVSTQERLIESVLLATAAELIETWERQATHSAARRGVAHVAKTRLLKLLQDLPSVNAKPIAEGIMEHHLATTSTVASLEPK